MREGNVVKIIKSKRFEGVVLWEGDLPPNKVVDIEKTDENIQIYLNTEMIVYKSRKQIFLPLSYIRRHFQLCP